jgi:hypothetical protein
VCVRAGCSLQAVRNVYGARPVSSASVFGKGVGVSFFSGSFAPNNSFKPTPHRGVNSVLCATLHAVATPLRGGLTQALGAEKHSFVMLFALQHCRILLQCSSECLSARFGFGRCAVRAQAWSICSSWLPCADNRGVALAVSAAPFGTSTVRVQGAPGLLGFGLSDLALVFRSSRAPSRLTVRSSRPRIVASPACLRYASTQSPPRRGAA